jgi:shikimate kinase
LKIFLIGFMGSGKTHWGRLLAEKLNLPFFDLDEQVVSHEGKPINEIFAENGEEYFREVEKNTLHMLSESHDSFIMASGGGTPCYFNNIEYMKNSGTTVWIDTMPEVLHQRLMKEKEQRPLIKDLSDDQLRGFILKKYSDRRIYYEQADIIVAEDPVELDKLIQRIFHE